MDRQVIGDILSLVEALRREGVRIDVARVELAIQALDQVPIETAATAYWVLRCVLTQRLEDVEIFDRIARDLADAAVASRDPPKTDVDASSGAVGDLVRQSDDEQGVQEQGVAWSFEERLRRLDFSEYSDEELRRVRDLVDMLAVTLPRRRKRRTKPSRKRHYFDPRRTLRAAARTHGVPLTPVWSERLLRPRKLLVLVDVSGSMQMASRAVLMFVQAAVQAGGPVEAFAFGTRLTRLTRQLRSRSVNVALGRVSAAIPDWGGGTRIAASLHLLMAIWGPRGVVRGAVVVIVSDGLEHGSPDLLAHEMARIQRSAHAVIWVNPLAGDADYEPTAAGMAAAMPYVDYFLPGHNLDALAGLADLLAGMSARRGSGRVDRRRLDRAG